MVMKTSRHTDAHPLMMTFMLLGGESINEALTYTQLLSGPLCFPITFIFVYSFGSTDLKQLLICELMINPDLNIMIST